MTGTCRLSLRAAASIASDMANDPKVQRAIEVVLVLLVVAVFGMIALAAALLRG